MEETILVVDDEKEIADLLEVYLQNEGYNVRKFYQGLPALTSIEQNPPDLALLDVMLPDIDGFKLCQQIRKRHFFPVIMLTAKVEDTDKIMGLTFGADDYITKPFNPLEVVARVKTQLRRAVRYNAMQENLSAAKSHTADSAQPVSPFDDTRLLTEELDIHGLVINKATHTCTLFDQPIALTPIEFSILWYLCVNQGRVISSEELFEEIWGEKYLNNNNTVMAHIGRIREKLHEPARNPRFIRTVWGVGYKVE